MAHTSYCIEHQTPSGHRLVQQVGTMTFPTAAAKTAHITVGFHKLVAGNLSLAEKPVGTKTALAGVVPYIVSNQITQCLDRIVVIGRVTAGPFKTGTISYSLYGY